MTAWKMYSRPSPWMRHGLQSRCCRGASAFLSYLQRYVCEPVLASAPGSSWLHTPKLGLRNYGLGCLENNRFLQAQVALPPSPLQVMVVQVPAGLRCKMQCRAKTKCIAFTGVTSVQPYKRSHWPRREVSDLQHAAKGATGRRNVFICFRCQRKQTLVLVLRLWFHISHFPLQN